jgi:PhnB protein
MAVQPIPDGHPTVTPYLVVTGAAKVIEFVKQVFDAQASECMTGPDGTIQHAAVRIGNSVVMLADATEKYPPRPGNLYVMVPDTDATYRRALAAGATSLREPADQFYGDRNAGVQDPAGNSWWIGTHVEDVSPEEQKRRAAARHEPPK